MVKELNIIKMEIYYMKVILLMVNLKEMDNIFMKIENIIKDNLKMVYFMEKEYYIIQMERLNMKVIILMIKKKEMENIFGKMVNIISANLKMI